jgi:hypothetical protein
VGFARVVLVLGHGFNPRIFPNIYVLLRIPPKLKVNQSHKVHYDGNESNSRRTIVSENVSDGVQVMLRQSLWQDLHNHPKRQPTDTHSDFISRALQALENNDEN